MVHILLSSHCYNYVLWIHTWWKMYNPWSITGIHYIISTEGQSSVVPIFGHIIITKWDPRVQYELHGRQSSCSWLKDNSQHFIVIIKHSHHLFQTIKYHVCVGYNRLPNAHIWQHVIKLLFKHQKHWAVCCNLLKWWLIDLCRMKSIYALTERARTSYLLMWLNYAIDHGSEKRHESGWKQWSLGV